MSLKSVYTDQEEIPVGLEEHYTERNGQWELQAEGMKSQADVDRLKLALQKERTDHKDARGRAARYSSLEDLGMPVEDILSAVDGYNSTRGEKQQESINTSKLERENTRLSNENKTLSEANKTSAEKYIKSVINSSLQTAASKAGVDPAAIEDVLLRGNYFEVTEEGSVITKEEGLDVEAWLGNIKDSKPHWFLGSSGGGARGSTDASSNGVSSNPFKSKNLYAASALIAKNPGKADKLAQMAGYSDAYIGAEEMMKK